MPSTIGNSDALYHNVDHDVGNARRLRYLEGTKAPNKQRRDFAHLIIACLFHDIGYVRGILNGDGDDGYIIDAKGNKTTLPRGSSDAALMPYHVDRSKLFVLDRVAKIKLLDATRVANAIEFTRFPPPDGASDSDNEEGMLVRAANLIGQLGDPHYLRKANALYYEFEEVGMNRQLGYSSPTDITDLYPRFYWNSVSAHIQTAIRYPSRRADGSGSLISTAMFFAPKASQTCAAHNGEKTVF